MRLMRALGGCYYCVLAEKSPQFVAALAPAALRLAQQRPLPRPRRHSIVTWSICSTAWLICSMPSVCSLLAVVISPMMSATRRTLTTISSMVEPAVSTCFTPSETLPTEVSIEPLISLAASAERWARCRYLARHHGKPAPRSPARASFHRRVQVPRCWSGRQCRRSRR